METNIYDILYLILESIHFTNSFVNSQIKYLSSNLTVPRVQSTAVPAKYLFFAQFKSQRTETKPKRVKRPRFKRYVVSQGKSKIEREITRAKDRITATSIQRIKKAPAISPSTWLSGPLNSTVRPRTLLQRAAHCRGLTRLPSALFRLTTALARGKINILRTHCRWQMRARQIRGRFCGFWLWKGPGLRRLKCQRAGPALMLILRGLGIWLRALPDVARLLSFGQ